MIEMIRPRAVPKLVPAVLSFVAGYVDSCTFLGLFGIFVAQMTGSFVLAGTQWVAPEPGLAVKLLAIPVFFLAGCVTTVLAAVAAARGRRPLPWILGLKCLLLTALLAVVLFGPPPRNINAPAVLAAALLAISAMGVQSAMVRLLMSGVASTNVMTTNTTQLAIDTTSVLLGRGNASASSPQVRAARERLAGLLPIAGGFLIGTALGALAYELAGFATLLAPVAITYATLAWAIASSDAP